MLNRTINIISIVALCCLITVIAFAQSYNGNGSFSGGSTGPGVYGRSFDFERTNGLVAAWLSSQQYNFVRGSTNIFALIDLTGNGFDLRSNIQTNMPAWNASVGTNDIPCLAFSTVDGETNKFLRCDRLASLFTGEDKPITMIFSAFDTRVNNQHTELGFGWSGATNQNASAIWFRMHNNLTIMTTGFAADTNQNASSIQVNNGNVPGTNRWLIFAVTYTGTNGTCWGNLRAGNVTAMDQGQRTLDQFTVGFLRGTSGGQVQQGGRYYLAGGEIFTNSFDGTGMTNLIMRFNRRLKQPPL